MKNLRAISKYIDVKKFKARPLQKFEEESLAQKLKLFAKNTNKLSYTFSFPKEHYANVVERMNTIGRIADEMDHHPEWTLQSSALHVDLNTHQIQGISEKDYLLAYVFEQLMQDLPQEKRILQKWNN